MGKCQSQCVKDVENAKETAHQIKYEVHVLQGSLNELKDTTAQIGSEVSQINYNVNGIKHSLKGLVQDVNGVKTDIKKLKFDVSEIKDTVGDINLIAIQILGVVEKNLAALSRNFDAIQSVERRLNQTFAITQAHMNVLETKMDVALASIEDAKNIIIDKISRAELNILGQMKGDKVSSIKSKLITFANYFKEERDNMSKLSLEEKIEMLTDPEGVMRGLLKSRTPQPHSLYSLLSDIINQKMAIPVDSNDEIAVVALDILLYGLQVYSLIILFLVDNYTLLADASYQKNDLEQFNSYISDGVRKFNSFSSTLKLFLTEISKLIDTVKGKEFIQIGRPDVIDFTSLMSEVMRVIETGLKDIEQLLPKEIHKNRYLFLEKHLFESG